MMRLNKTLSYLLNNFMQDKTILLTEKPGFFNLWEELGSVFIVLSNSTENFSIFLKEKNFDAYIGKIQLRWGTTE